MLFILIESIELTGGNIQVMLFIEMETVEFDYPAAILK